MSWILIKRRPSGSNVSNMHEWQIDDPADILTPPEEALHSAVGSIAYTANGVNTYKKISDGQWIETVNEYRQDDEDDGTDSSSIIVLTETEWSPPDMPDDYTFTVLPMSTTELIDAFLHGKTIIVNFDADNDQKHGVITEIYSSSKAQLEVWSSATFVVGDAMWSGYGDEYPEREVEAH